MPELDSLSDKALKSLVLQHQAKLQDLTRKNRFLAWKPALLQAQWWLSQAQYVLLLAGNRVGKSTTGAGICLADGLGIMPYALGGPQTLDLKPGSKEGYTILCAGESFEQLRDVIVKKLKYFLTPEMLRAAPRKTNGVETFFPLITGADIICMSYKQDLRDWEGKTIHRAWFDEPPPRRYYTAAIRGLATTGGKVLITATPLSEPWMLDELVYPGQDENSPLFGKVDYFRINMHDMCRDCHPDTGAYMSHDEIETILSQMPPNERAARAHGFFADLQGLEFTELDEKIHVVDDFAIPRAWPIAEVVDPAPRKGLYVAWFACNEKNLWFLHQAAHIDYAPFSYYCQELRRHRAMLPHNPDLMIIDSRMGTQHANLETQETWLKCFAKFGFRYEPSHGKIPLETLHGWMRPEWDAGNDQRVPRIRMFRSVAQMREGPLWGLQRFQWNPLATYRETYGQKGKDWVDLLRYLSGREPEPTYERFAHRERDPFGLNEVPKAMEAFTRTGRHDQLQMRLRERSTSRGYRERLKIPLGYSED